MRKAIPFGEWLPDLPDVSNPGTSNVKNVIPYTGRYRPLKSLLTTSNAMTGYCRGAFAAQDKDAGVYNYGGDATKLYRLADATWTDASKSGGYTTGDEYWEFARWGNKVLATNFANPIQVITMGGSTFADLAAAAPKARHLAIIRDFVVVGNTSDSTDGNVPHRVRWSAFNNELDWNVSSSTQADFQDLQGTGGWVQAIVPGEQGTIFQERGIWRMSYAGAPIVFQFDQIEGSIGCLAPRSVVWISGAIFFLSDDGFYRLAGNTLEPIGHNKIDRTFFNDLDHENSDRIVGAADPLEKLIYWIYPGVGSSNNIPNKLLIYNWADNKWATGEIEAEFIYRYLSPGYTAEGLDNVSSSIDALNVPLDSRFWAGGDSFLAVFDKNHKLGTLTGAALAATVETGEFSLHNGVTTLTSVRPLVEGGTHTVSVGKRKKQSDSVTYGLTSTENDSGICNLRATSRYHRIKVDISGDFTDATGVEVDGVYAGDR